MTLDRFRGSKIFNRQNSFASKIDTILKLQKGSIYYLPKIGANIGFFIDDPNNYSINTFNNYVISELLANQIYVTSFVGEIDKENKFTIALNIKGSLGNIGTSGIFNTKI